MNAKHGGVSFIVPVFNKALFVNDCIDSICSQTISNFEVICIDDCSQDDSLQQLQRYSGKKWFRLVMNRSNLGAGPSRNRGTSIATKEFIRFVDADDLLPECSTQILLECANQEATNLVRGNVEIFDSTTGKTIRIPNRVTKKSSFQFHTDLSVRIPWFHTTYLLRRDLLLNNYIAYPSLRAGEDPVFMASLLCSAKNVATVDEIVYKYRSTKRKKVANTGDLYDYIEHARLVRDVFLANGYSACWLDYCSLIRRDATYWLSTLSVDDQELPAIQARINRVLDCGNGAA